MDLQVVRRCLFRLLLILGGIAGTGPGDNAVAQSDRFPTKPVRLVVPYAPGGGLDVLARVVAERLTADLGQNVIVENKPGANGAIAALDVSKSQDGHTFLVGDVGTISINPALYSNLPYDPSRDLVPITTAVKLPLVVVTSSSGPFATIEQLLGKARSDPNAVSYGSVGIGGIAHLTAELMLHESKLRMVHVPYRGAPAVLADVMTGRVDATVTSLVSASELLEGGKLRALAVTGRTRAAQLPNTPTLAEAALPNFDVASWISFHAPPSTPTVVVARINASILAYLTSIEGRERVAKLGFEVVGNTPQEAHELAQRETERWRGVIEAAGIQRN